MSAVIKGYFELLGGTNFPENTVQRIKKFSDELKQNREYEKITSFLSNSDTMVILNNLRVFSFCEHHLLPYFGYCSIGYIPKGKVLGLSKFQRIVDRCASRPTIQEQLTHDLADTLLGFLGEKTDIAVAITCIHSCMFGRGVKNSDVSVNTMALRNGMKQNDLPRSEFLQRITKHDNIFR